jgi:FkbM family methyltransferase
VSTQSEQMQEISQTNYLPSPAAELPANWIDREFRFLTDFIRNRDLQQVKEAVIDSLHSFEEKDKPNYTATIEYYNKYKMWGEYHPESGNFGLAEIRARALWEHRRDFEWLYGKLYDFRSKKVLLNILSYWLSSESHYITDIQDKYFHQYFDYDILVPDSDEVIVDLGAYVGDTMADYVKMFGAGSYKRYYCYEIVPESVAYIDINVKRMGLRNVVVRAKGASDENGMLYIQCDGVPSVSRLAQCGETAVETVRIDDDIGEPVTFIKMDIEGAEEQALMGCRGKIRDSHPKLALSAYHNHKDMWKLARIVDAIDSTYRFYLRYYGRALLPTEYVLYAI